MRTTLVLAGSVLLLTSLTSASLADSYDVTVLPFTAPSPLLSPVATLSNNSGVVAGQLANPDGSVSLAEWSSDSLVNLGLPSGLPPGVNRVTPFGINDSGTVVGTIAGAAGGVPSVAFSFASGRFTILPLADTSDLGGIATGINASGRITGYDTAASGSRAWTWASGSYAPVVVPGSSNTLALGINSGGTVIGGYTADCCPTAGEHGFIVTAAQTYLLNGAANGINDAGTVAGSLDTQGGAIAAVFVNGMATSILSRPSTATSINFAGEVVGDYDTTSGERVFRWSQTTGAVDLTPAGFQFTVALGINNLGDILEMGETSGGVFEDLLLTPDPNGVLRSKPLVPPQAAAPEPTTGLLFGTGLLVMFLRGLRAARPMPAADRRRSAFAS